jgi:SAM-dependent methyltransferase
LHISEALSTLRSLGSGETYVSVARLLHDGLDAGDQSEVTAFEDNRDFVYAVGINGRESRQVIRRVLILKPSVLVVDDLIRERGAKSAVEWRLYSSQPLEYKGHRVQFVDNAQTLSCETLLPQNLTYRIEHPSGDKSDPELVVAEQPGGDKPATRFLHVLSAGGPPPASDLTVSRGAPHLTISVEGRVYRLTLPAPDVGAGEIEISRNGATVLASRPLTAGILPHGPEGNHLLELWDADYRGKAPPLWDIGHPAHELEEVVDQGKVRRCRAVDLCCGSGTDAVYLASKGFDVTGIDVAPTALSQAQRRARQAGVSVRWLLADVLAPPKLESFDFIYDRGCYHVVRDQNLAAYLETLRRISRPGTQFLLLAARADEDEKSALHSGVTEEELRYDFLSLFDIEWMNQSTLENNRGANPSGWSVLLRRKGTEGAGTPASQDSPR